MHKHGRAFFFFIGWLLVRASASGQCPQPAFTVPDTVCADQALPLVNTSTGADRYEWDFCSGDLARTPVVTELVTAAAANIPTNITALTDGTNWYAFFFSRDNNQLYRLDFGSHPANTPAVVNLGALGGLIQRPEPLEFVKDGANWYALTANSYGNSNLIRLNFGTSLTSTPSVNDLGNFGGWLTRPRGIKIRQDGGNYVAIVTNANDNTLVLINFGTSIATAPGIGSVLKTSPFPGASVELINTAVIRDCNEWVGLTVDRTASRIYRLSFGTALFSLPGVSLLPAALPANADLFSVELAYDGGFAAFTEGWSGEVHYLNFGESMTNTAPQVTNLGNFGMLSNIGGLSLVKHAPSSAWVGYAVNFSLNKIYQFSFPNPCGMLPSAAAAGALPAVNYSGGGPKSITLTAHGPGGAKSTTRSIFVQAKIAVDFTAAGSPPTFTAITAPGDKIVEWEWDFGNGIPVKSASLVHNFPADGDYNVTLTVRGEEKNRCGQTASITKKISVAGNGVLTCPLPSFSLPDTVCINQPFTVTNSTLGGSRYEWDFCGVDMGQKPVQQPLATIPQALILSDITTVFDGVNWYGFATSRDNARLYRLSFGNSLSNPPQVNDLGYPGNVLFGPEQLKIVKEGNNWYGLLAQYLYFPGLVRLSFGNSLTNLPTFERLTALNGFFKLPRGVAIAQDNGQTVALVTNDKDNTLTIINFKNSILNNPTPADVIVTNPLPGVSSGLVGVSVIKECENWYGIATSYAKGLYKLDFGPALWNRPAVTDLTRTYDFPLGPGRAAITNNNGNYLAFTMLLNGDLLKLDFRQSIAANRPAVTKVGEIAGDGYGLDLINGNGEQLLLATDYTAKKIFTFRFPATCSANARTSTQQNPANVSYGQGGWQKIALKAFNERGYESVTVDSVFVRPAPNAAFSVSPRCEGAPATFTATPPSGGSQVASWTWAFGDGSTATGLTARHTFSTAGTYPVVLTVKDKCGNEVRNQQFIQIYKNTAPAFTGPTDFCSHEPVSFADASVVFNDTPQSWSWDFGDGGTATGKNVTYTYPQHGTFNVTLTVTGISGCAVSVSKPVRVTPGIGVRFSESGVCIGAQTQFTEELTVPEGVGIVSRTWTFGDGATSNAENPVHDYTTTGTYPVILIIVNDRGCTNRFEKTITIQRLPQAAFTHSLACMGEPVAFADESVARGGSIVGWRWDFGDPESGDENIADEQHAQHAFGKAGTYKVQLKVFTSFGCTDSTTQTITVIAAPQADFGYQADGQTRVVAFVGQSSAGAGNAITDWYWEFGDGNIATEPNPSHAYAQAGSYPVTLIVTSDTRCRGEIKKTVHVYDPPQAAFGLAATLCAGTSLTLEDNTAAAPGDPVTGWQWQVGTQTFTDRSPTLTIAPGATQISVTLTVTTASGQQSTATRSAAVAPAPEARFSHESAGPQQPLQIRFSNASAGADRYQWNFGDGQTSTLQHPVHTYAAAGTYPVTLTTTSAQGCSDTTGQSVTVHAVTETYGLKLEGLRVHTVGSTSSVQLRLLNGSTRPFTALSFTFAFNESRREAHTWPGQLRPGGTLNLAFPLPEGMTAADIVSLCGWAKDEASGTVSNRACITPNDQFVLLNPAPNPARDQYRLAFILPQAGDARLEMVDALGRTVCNEPLRGCRQGYNERVRPLVTLAGGFYLIRLFYEGQVQTKPLLVD